MKNGRKKKPRTYSNETVDLLRDAFKMAFNPWDYEEEDLEKELKDDPYSFAKTLLYELNKMAKEPDLYDMDLIRESKALIRKSKIFQDGTNKEGAVKMPPSKFIDMFNDYQKGKETQQGRFYCEYEGIFVAGYNENGTLILADFEHEKVAIEWLQNKDLTTSEAMAIDNFITSHKETI